MIKKLIKLTNLPKRVILTALMMSALELIVAACAMRFAKALGDQSPMAVNFGLLLVLGYAGKNIFGALETLLQNLLVMQTATRIRRALMQTFSKMSYEKYTQLNSTIPVNVIENDAERVVNIGMLSLCGLISEGVIFVCLIGLCFWLNPGIAAGAFFVCAFIALGLKKSSRYYRLGKSLQSANVSCLKILNEFFGAFKEIKVYNKAEQFAHPYFKEMQERGNLYMQLNFLNALPRYLIEMCFATFLLCVLLIVKDNMLVVLSGYVYVAFRLMPALNRLITYYNNLKQVAPSIERVYEHLS